MVYTVQCTCMCVSVYYNVHLCVLQHQLDATPYNSISMCGHHEVNAAASMHTNTRTHSNSNTEYAQYIEHDRLSDRFY